MSDVTIGHLLAFGGGTHLVLAGSETWPIVLKNTTTTVRKLVALVGFSIGCIAMGLILLDHKHCTQGGHSHGGDGHGGHTHRFFL